MSAAPDPGTVKRALSAHAAIGLLAGALLYLVSLTGTLAVFYAEFQRVEQQGVPEMTAIAPEAVARGVAAMVATEAGKPKTTHLYVHMPVEDLPRATITTDNQAFHLRADGSLAQKEEIAWSDFLLQLHYLLNLPALFGILLVGALGVAMLALAVSGVVAHPRIFRDAFRLRARDANALADWHNRLSVWTLPFSVAIALTGAIIGTATLTGYAIASADHGGDLEKVYAPIYGAEAKPDPAPAPLPDVAAALRHMAAHHPDVVVSYAILHDPGTKGQHIQIVGEHQRRLIFGEYYGFDAAGQFQHRAGLADGAVGQQAAASLYRLHFGTFGGLPVKIAYFVFGAALTAICATGTFLWLGKRRRRGFDEPRLLAAWRGVVWGWPIALAASFVARIAIGNDAPLVPIFWGGAVLVVVAAVALARWRPLPRLLQGGLVAAIGADAVAAIV
ncbi:PepSY domain-containing protein [Sphingosinicella sp. BN140058]|uniref:PepSY-associated TM helix domain-containing protein n=1 Tax=Sphingosinicella sp. BN140058 TaxID=1892855 RepID=UPI00101364DC|nr:PepSY-associated TM helix domain-containing protein [Sphingosinicella sp. BN140058]QAY76734.1 PepSY domain-containing protein [Sphingosinicella sp. BN140058]